ncbi:unnamed protein product [Acanthoscelides obtectus]|uniref:Retrotransposon gag domain-containing protein n=1 Tax=Acanthoscelides obtectus TaxID=200917 RepID=A0A9P0PXL7_ACAOB|nr:unnamed protein product [Acanthoscelides obtectus]CAK1654655.1 hypothetical protein AOBTE_LOCUS18743 [Acanthoscelides obtectus]
MAPKKPKANVNEENSLLGSLDESESPQCSELKNMVNNLADDFKRLQTSLSGGSRQYVGLWRDLGGHTLTFVPNGPVHPMNFLRKIMHILDEAGVPETARLKLVTGCLRGSAAEWAEIKEDSFDSFQSFIDAFMDRYWGVKEQRALYYEIKYGKFRSGSRADYVLRMAKLASFLTDKISESELVRFLSQHFTQEPEIHRAVLIQNMKTIEELEGFLRNLDEVDATSRDRRNEGRGGYNPPNHNGNRNFRQDAQGENNRNDQDRAIRFIDVGEDLLSEIEDGGDGDEGHQMISSTVKGNVYGEEVNILLDSGSQCCAISDEFYKKINSDENGILVLPVVNFSVTGAVGKKQQRIKQQVLVKIEIGGCVFEIPCIVVPHLNRSVILGSDWFLKEHVKLDYDDLVLAVDEKSLKVRIQLERRDEAQLSINFLQEGQMKDRNRHRYTDFEIKEVVTKAESFDEREKPGQLLTVDLMGPLPPSRGGATQLFVVVKFTCFIMDLWLKTGVLKKTAISATDAEMQGSNSNRYGFVHFKVGEIRVKWDTYV